MSPRTGRPKSSNPKNVRLEIRLTKSEAEELQALADKLNTNKTDVIIRGIKLLQSEHKKQDKAPVAKHQLYPIAAESVSA